MVQLYIPFIENTNAQKEYYLTDLPVIARKDNRQTHIVEVPAAEMEGIIRWRARHGQR
jgi:bifunctional N-acetylglucosamine-1-phosphate-uridyltransferase/glucosamine-1-phosphate-acetyltransferase GlmU-like protein